MKNIITFLLLLIFTSKSGAINNDNDYINKSSLELNADSCKDLKECVIKMIQVATTRNIEALSKIAKAIDTLKKPEKGDRKLARISNQQGLAALNSGQIIDAISFFSKAHEADPHDEEIVNNYLYTLLKSNDNIKVIELIHDGIILNPRSANLWFTYAVANLNLEKSNDSAASFWIAWHYSRDKNKMLILLEKTISSVNNEKDKSFLETVKASLTEDPQFQQEVNNKINLQDNFNKTESAKRIAEQESARINYDEKLKVALSKAFFLHRTNKICENLAWGDTQNKEIEKLIDKCKIDLPNLYLQEIKKPTFIPEDCAQWALKNGYEPDKVRVDVKASVFSESSDKLIQFYGKIRSSDNNILTIQKEGRKSNQLNLRQLQILEGLNQIEMGLALMGESHSVTKTNDSDEDQNFFLKIDDKTFVIDKDSIAINSQINGYGFKIENANVVLTNGEKTTVPIIKAACIILDS